MENAAAYTEADQRLEVRDFESAAREMEELVSRRLPYFYGVAYRFLGNAADAEDVVQDALFTAYKKLNQFRGDSQLSTWLTTIVSNCARMHLRSRPRHVHVSLDDPIGTEQESTLLELMPSGGPSPEDECRRSETRKQLTHAATRLSPSLRRILRLRDVEGLSIREAAKTLGVARGTVKAQSSRARARMRRLLSQRRSRIRHSGVTVTP